MKQVSEVFCCFPGCTRMEKELSMLFKVPHSFRGKFKKSDFNSSQVSSFLEEDSILVYYQALFVSFSFRGSNICGAKDRC